MTNHKCGGCFFFQEAGFAGTGWCLNADRAKSADVRSLVRRNELACRNDWGTSLWTDPREAAATGASRKRINLQAERPATAVEISSVVNGRDTVADAPSARDMPLDDGPAVSFTSSSPVAEATPGGEDVVVGHISVLPSGRTGRRTLVDQVPADVLPRMRPSLDVQAPGGSAAVDSTHAAPVTPRPLRPEPTMAPTPAIPTQSPPTGPARIDGRMLPPQPHHPANRSGPTIADRTAGHPTLAVPGAPIGDVSPGPANNGGTDVLHLERPVADTTPRRDVPSHLPPGLNPAPVPAPVPARELNHRDTRASMSASLPAAPALRGPVGPTMGRPAASPEQPSLGRPSLSRSLPDQPAPSSHDVRPPRSSALPDLADAMSDREVPDRIRSPRTARSQPPVDPVLDAPALSLGTEGSSPTAPVPPPVRRLTSRPVAGTPEPFDHPESRTVGDAIDAERDLRSQRSRPAVPRMATDRGDVAPAARTIPTVSDVREGRHRGPHDVAASPPSDRSVRTGSPRPQVPHAAASSDGRPGRGSAERDTPLDREPARDRTVDQLLPPVQLRPELVDYGDYGDWMKLDPVTPRLAPDLARSCATCRDFRPANNGERGWCANRDAFTLRKVVYADELPCMNSFGCWWVPYDDVWLSEANIREHRYPTPLLDQMMPDLHLTVGESERRRS